MRVKLSNRYGTAPLVVSAASIALRNGNEQIFAASVRPLTFSGKTSFTIPAFAELYSDWVSLSVPSLSGALDRPLRRRRHVGRNVAADAPQRPPGAAARLVSRRRQPGRRDGVPDHGDAHRSSTS